MKLRKPKRPAGEDMGLIAYRLDDRAVALQPVSEASGTGLPDLGVDGHGWLLSCPCAFEARWNGGPGAGDVEIRLETADDPGDPACGFVESALGGGRLTFHPGYQFKTTGAHSLWVRGPVNRPKDGLVPLESLVDTSRLPSAVAVHWQLTRPHQTVRFEAGEPFGTVLPYPQGYAEQLELEVGDLEDALADYQRELARSLEAPAMQEILRRLQGDGAAETVMAASSARPAASAPWAAWAKWAAGLSDPPPVSCICPTYGRVGPLEEAIYSFLQQDYPGKKELIVVNDYEGQTLELDHPEPEVRIVNLPRRLRSVGEKYKAAAAFASHDLIFVWHDDDIYLPHRLSLSVALFEPERGFFKADRAWFLNDGELSGPDSNILHGGCCWARALWAETPGYPHVGSGYDFGFEERCNERRFGAPVAHWLAREDVYYIYRWSGTGSYHLSAGGHNGEEHERVAAHVARQAAAGEIAQGAIRLKPHWKADYPALVQSRLRQTEPEPELPFPPPFFAIPAPAPLPEDAAAALFRGTQPLSISVILPSLNESVLLARTVEQLAATLPPASEIIVVDNGSTDGCADFLRSSPREGVKLIEASAPLGVAGARNRGLAEARGEVIVFADAHVDVPERWWQPLVAMLNRPGVGLVAPKLGTMGRPEIRPTCGLQLAQPGLRLEWLRCRQREPHRVPVVSGAFMAMRHETLASAGAFDGGMVQWGAEDTEICLRYWLLGHEVWVVPEVTVMHNVRAVNRLWVNLHVAHYNQMRFALLHFSPERLARTVREVQKTIELGPILARAVASDLWPRRSALAGRRVRDDDWLFETFRETCSTVPAGREGLSA